VFVIVRHGKTFAAGEPPRRIGARTDLPLTAEGEQEARRLGNHFAALGWRFGKALVSPLLRAQQTAAPILAAQGTAITPRRRISLPRSTTDRTRTGPRTPCWRDRQRRTAGWDHAAEPPPGWTVNASARIAAWADLFARAPVDPDAPVLLVTSNGAARFALLADPALRTAADALPSLKLPTGGYGVIRRAADGGLRFRSGASALEHDLAARCARRRFRASMRRSRSPALPPNRRKTAIRQPVRPHPRRASRRRVLGKARRAFAPASIVLRPRSADEAPALASGIGQQEAAEALWVAPLARMQSIRGLCSTARACSWRTAMTNGSPWRASPACRCAFCRLAARRTGRRAGGAGSHGPARAGHAVLSRSVHRRGTTLSATITTLAEWRRSSTATGIVAACGMAWWKREEIRRFLWCPGQPLRIVSRPARALDLAARHDGQVAIWPSRVSPALLTAAEDKGVPLVRVEDGFVRSVGLGSNLVPPSSIVVDRQGIHFDPSGPSDLETISPRPASRPS
jgi:broad specificity phosphatase PhoE